MDLAKGCELTFETNFSVGVDYLATLGQENIRDPLYLTCVADKTSDVAL